METRETCNATRTANESRHPQHPVLATYNGYPDSKRVRPFMYVTRGGYRIVYLATLPGQQKSSETITQKLHGVAVRTASLPYRDSPRSLGATESTR